MASDASIARQATPPEIVFGRRLPSSELIRKPTSGSSGISASMPLPFQTRKGFRAERLAMPEQGNDESQPHRGFRRRHRHDEERDDLPVDGAEVAPGRDERQVHRVE